MQHGLELSGHSVAWLPREPIGTTRVFKIVFASAIGWGMGGMISYGLVVGYGRGKDFFNVYYGLIMLFVIGALYGFLAAVLWDRPG